MSFWNIDLDDWIRRQLHFDESVSTYVFRAAGWYDNRNYSSWHNKYSEFHDIIEWYNADLLGAQDLLEKEFRETISGHNKQEWLEELMIEEEYQTMPEKQINLESFILYYYHINAISKVSSRRRKETKESKRSSNNRLSSYVNDDARTHVCPDPDVLYSEDKELVKGDYPLEIIRSDNLIRITTQTPFVDNKNRIKVIIYNNGSIEISVDDDGTLERSKKYYRIVEVPKDADIETAKCTYRNGILVITFKQKKKHLHHTRYTP